MINRAVLTGRLTKDPELRTTQSGLSVVSFNLAVDRPFKDNNGNHGADFISCVIWRKAAENFCNFTSKGSLVGIDGRIQTRNYQDNDGKTVYVTEVLVESFTLLESKKDRLSNSNGGNGNNNAYGNNNNGTNYTNNSSTQSQAPDPFAGSGDTIDITDDDLPF
ncbi:MAG: single-stranded DNA-binding protein [Lactobacillus sp.]|nr:single-stranded DNA-binding protein [Lactobacillus sp.]